MINLDENVKSEVQIRLQEKLERDRKRLQEQIKKEHKQVEELKRKSRAMIGDLFAEHLPDFYNFEAAELKEIIDTAMTQKATNDKITAIRNAAMSAKLVIKAEPQVKGDEELLSVDEVDEDMEEADNTYDE